MNWKEHIFRENRVRVKAACWTGKKGGLEGYLKIKAKMILVNYYNDQETENDLADNLALFGSREALRKFVYATYI